METQFTENRSGERKREKYTSGKQWEVKKKM
jgi:hypothetical protein